MPISKFWETYTDLLNVNEFDEIEDNLGIHRPISQIRIFRKEDYGLFLTATSQLQLIVDRDEAELGLVEQAHGIFTFRADGMEYQCDGISVGSRNVSDAIHQELKVGSIEVRNQNSFDATNTIEWCIANRRNSLIYPDQAGNTWDERNLIQLRSPESQFHFLLQEDTQDLAFSTSLFLRLEGTDLALIKKQVSDDHDLVALVYSNVVDQTIRQRIRKSLGFVLNLHFAMLSSTNVDRNLRVANAKIFSPYTLNGLIFTPPLPPGLVSDDGNYYSSARIANQVNSLMQNFEALNFNYLYWDYFRAKSLPFDMGVVFIGAALEALQREYCENTGVRLGSRITSKSKFRLFRSAVTETITDSEWSAAQKKQISNKINNINRASQSE